MGERKKKKIAVIIPKYGLVGGAEGFACEVTEKLAAREDLDIHVFANQWRPGASVVKCHKVPVLPFPRFLKPLSFAYFSNKAVSKQSFDLIHSHDRIFRMDIMTMHGVPHRTWVRQVRRKVPNLFDLSLSWLEEKTLKGPGCPLVLPVSELVKDELLKRFHIPSSKIQVIHPGVSRGRFERLDKEMCRAHICRRHGFSTGALVLLFVSMNFELKRLDLVLRAMGALRQEKKEGSENLVLLVVGKGNVGRYRQMARELGLENRTAFAGVTREIEQYYLACDIFLMPSRFDTFGMAVLEAMMAGVPVIITKRVGAKDLIRSGVQGFILEGDPTVPEMASKLSHLMDRDTRRRMGAEARKVAARHNWDRVAEEILGQYDKRLASGFGHGA